MRGIDAYRRSWPSFFEWLRAGAQLELVELDVTAGADVAFASALLRKKGDRWIIAHEHHSFPMTDTVS